MNDQNLIKAVNHLLLVISNDSNDYADLSLFRQIQDAVQKVENALRNDKWHNFADSVIQFAGDHDQ